MRNVLERVPADETDEWQGIDWREAGNQNPSGGIFQLRKQSTYSAISGTQASQKWDDKISSCHES